MSFAERGFGICATCQKPILGGSMMIWAGCISHANGDCENGLPTEVERRRQAKEWPSPIAWTADFWSWD